LQIFFTIDIPVYSMKDFNQGELESATSSTNALILFYADWCGYCKSFLPIFEDSVKNLSNQKILFGGVKLNEDENPLWDKYGINAVPTLIAFSKSTIKDRRDAKMGVGLTKSDMDAILSNIGT
jgi:thioredoxin 1